MASGLVADYGSDNGSDNASDNGSNFTDSDDDYERVVLNDDQIDVPGMSVPAVVKVSSSETDHGGKEASPDLKDATVDCRSVEKDPLSRAADEDISDDEDENEDDETHVDEAEEKPSEPSRLPNPLLGQASGVKHSVFSTEYEHRESAKRSVLEKHVKLTDDELEKKRNRPVCKGFLRGDCRYGLRCKFKHEQPADGQKQSAAPAQPPTDPNPPTRGYKQPVVLESPHRLEVQEDVPDDDKYGSNQARKRRYGVTNTLAPPKKAMRDLEKQRVRDRPWTQQH